MSRWRSVALAYMPSHKRIIERAKSPAALWIAMRHEFESACRTKPLVPEKVLEIYEFALQCSRDARVGHVARDVWLFCSYVMSRFVMGDEAMRRELPRLMNLVDFDRWMEMAAGDCSAEERAQARTAFFVGRP